MYDNPSLPYRCPACLQSVSPCTEDATTNCYFCQYCKPCSECPLDKNCFLYYEVCDKHDITSAELILNAIRGYAND